MAISKKEPYLDEIAFTLLKRSFESSYAHIVHRPKIV